MCIVGDALLATTGARRINYEILGNADPELHAHIFPRFEDEPAERRHGPAWFYDWNSAPPFSIAEHGDLMKRIAHAIDATGQPPGDAS
jgi:diadenosine tetraphosphate (Ap4A) HIT family hydrolase